MALLVLIGMLISVRCSSTTGGTKVLSLNTTQHRWLVLLQRVPLLALSMVSINAAVLAHTSTCRSQKGDTHRIRLINSAVDTHFKVMIDDHNMTVMAADFVPIRPYSTQVLSIGIGTPMMSSNLGQRYDIVVDANQDVGNYWFRAIPQASCSTNGNTDGIVAIVRYVDAEEEDPTTSAYTYTDSCSDENPTNLIPILEISPTTFISGQTLEVAIAPENGLFYWSVNSSSLYLNWYK